MAQHSWSAPIRYHNDEAMQSGDPPPSEQFPQVMHFRFESSVDPTLGLPLVQLYYQGAKLGDPLDDNSRDADGYRYHDVIHMAHATVLGWSPVLRAMLGKQRRSSATADRVEDGARAKALEEGISACMYALAKDRGWRLADKDWRLIEHVVLPCVRELEVATRPITEWRDAYTQAFSVMDCLRNGTSTTVKCDLGTRQMSCA